MADNLVVVESPAKAKTIEKYLGKNFQVLASYGHVRDLVPKEGAVDPDNDFKMNYQQLEKNQKHVDKIAKALQKADHLYLATDPDREGEAIAWHLCQVLEENQALQGTNVHRIVFYQITKNSIQEAVQKPRDIAMELVNAQQARRALDFLVGFNLSPLLWKKVKPGLSAGRVQSPALRLIVEREIEIEQFEPKEYWSITAEAQTQKHPIQAKLTHYQGNKLGQFDINSQSLANEAIDTIKTEAQGQLLVHNVERKQRRKNPAPPFITSTLQQEAARKLGFNAERTMRLAQQLYEGVELEQGATGLITYMRTDSVNLASEAVNEMRQYIEEQYGTPNLPDKPRQYRKQSKNAQEAHEAIRPTSVRRTPDSVKHALNNDQFKLYQLIWRRTIACQMVHATMNTMTVDLLAGNNHYFRATGSSIAHPGFMIVYQEDQDDATKQETDDKMLPDMEQGQRLELNDIVGQQHFTEPPPRYSEASLVKTLEEYGIGRPSTYASILSTLRQRYYVTMDNKRFVPTDIGRTVNYFLTEYFPRYVDYGFTAQLEDELDAISRGEEDIVPLLEKFWRPFKDRVQEVEQSVSKKDVTQTQLDEACPECGNHLVKRLGKRGHFIGCSGYPDCRYTRSLEDSDDDSSSEAIEGRQCPKCESQLEIKRGRYGKFIGCSNYPNCKYVEPLEKPQDTGINCPKCQNHTLLKRKTRRGKYFFACGGYPDCQYAVWDPPHETPCPKCQWPILTVKTTKKRGEEWVCPQKECDYREAVERDGS